MENLNQGQEISKFRKDVFDDGQFITHLIVLFLFLGGLVIGVILNILTLFNLKYIFNIIPTKNVNDILFYILCITSIISTFFYYYTRPSKDKNPSVSFFTNYLLVRNERGEVEVPFKMIKRFRLLENEKKVVVEYKEEYMICVNMKDTGNNFMYIVCENPRLAEDLILPGPDSIHFPQDKKIIYDKGEFSFRLKSNSRKINLSIVDELNKRIV
jgi:hypothetical protein